MFYVYFAHQTVSTSFQISVLILLLHRVGGVGSEVRGLGCEVWGV